MGKEGVTVLGAVGTLEPPRVKSRCAPQRHAGAQRRPCSWVLQHPLAIIIVTGNLATSCSTLAVAGFAVLRKDQPGCGPAHPVAAGFQKAVDRAGGAAAVMLVVGATGILGSSATGGMLELGIAVSIPAAGAAVVVRPASRSRRNRDQPKSFTVFCDGCADATPAEWGHPGSTRYRDDLHTPIDPPPCGIGWRTRSGAGCAGRASASRHAGPPVANATPEAAARCPRRGPASLRPAVRRQPIRTPTPRSDGGPRVRNCAAEEMAAKLRRLRWVYVDPEYGWPGGGSSVAHQSVTTPRIVGAGRPVNAAGRHGVGGHHDVPGANTVSVVADNPTRTRCDLSYLRCRTIRSLQRCGRGDGEGPHPVPGRPACRARTSGQQQDEGVGCASSSSRTTPGQESLHDAARQTVDIGKGFQRIDEKRCRASTGGQCLGRIAGAV